MKISKIKKAYLSKRMFLTFSTFFVASFMSAYLSMGKFSNAMSSGCFKCSFFEEVFINALVTSIFLTILFLATSKIKMKSIRLSIDFVLLIFCLLFWNYSIFVSRKSSWSTYLFEEELYYVFSFSFQPVLFLTIIAIIIIHYGGKKLKSGIEKVTLQ